MLNMCVAVMYLNKMCNASKFENKASIFKNNASKSKNNASKPRKDTVTQPWRYLFLWIIICEIITKFSQVYYKSY